MLFQQKLSPVHKKPYKTIAFSTLFVVGLRWPQLAPVGPCWPLLAPMVSGTNGTGTNDTGTNDTGTNDTGTNGNQTANPPLLEPAGTNVPKKHCFILLFVKQ